MKTGQRWYAGTDLGGEYATILAFGTEEATGTPALAERSIGDLLAPERPGSLTAILNAVTREVGLDAADWPAHRLLGMAGQLEFEAEQRGPPPGGEG